METEVGWKEQEVLLVEHVNISQVMSARNESGVTWKAFVASLNRTWLGLIFDKVHERNGKFQAPASQQHKLQSQLSDEKSFPPWPVHVFLVNFGENCLEFVVWICFWRMQFSNQGNLGILQDRLHLLKGQSLATEDVRFLRTQLGDSHRHGRHSDTWRLIQLLWDIRAPNCIKRTVAFKYASRPCCCLHAPQIVAVIKDFRPHLLVECFKTSGFCSTPLLAFSLPTCVPFAVWFWIWAGLCSRPVLWFRAGYCLTG